MDQPSKEEILAEARKLYFEMQRLLGSKGGSQNTEKQRQARSENLKRARWKRYHPFEPYPDDL